jgi:hypothetical protein
MDGYASQGNQYGSEFGRRVEETVADMADELRRAVNYVDRVIVPEVRRETGGALRSLARHMDRWADSLDPDHAGGRPPL